MKQRFFLYTVILLAACGGKKQEAATPHTEADANTITLTDAQMKKAGIQTGEVQLQTINSRLQVNGMIDVPPQNMISVGFPLGGYLKSTHLLPGSHVNKGDALAVLEDPQYIQLQQDYLVARAKLAYTRADYNRQEELAGSQAASQKAVQMAKSEYAAQRVLVKALAQKLSLININAERLTEDKISRSVRVYSPISGFVTKVNVNIGKYISPTDVLFELVDPSDIHLNLTVFEKDAALLANGQKVVAYSNDLPDKKHAAEIFLISRNVNEDRAVNVHCHFDQYDPLLLPGMYMRAVVDVNGRQLPSLPEDAIVRWQNKFYVFAVTGKNSFEQVEVKPGETADGFTAVEPVGKIPLTGRQLVTHNAYTLLMKMKNSAEEE